VLRKLVIVIVLITVFVFVSALGESFFGTKQSAVFGIGRVSEPVFRTIDSFLAHQPPSDPAALEGENARLRAELELLAASACLRSGVQQVVRARMYSTYPFNNRGFVTINAGARDGISLSRTVTIDGVYLFGTVVEVFDSYSVVRTIFDSGWEVPVKIGDTAAGTDALLVGGREPRLTLIAKEAGVADGAPVYVVASDFTYGLTVGAVLDVRGNESSAFYESAITVPYEVSTLTEVWVLL
jgi:cell shape-determining protein MreC